jgi:hypothetical protein
MIIYEKYMRNASAEKGPDMEARQPRNTAGRHRGPSLPAVAAVYTTLVLASVVVPTAMAEGRHFPSPFEPDALRWFADYRYAALTTAFLVFSSAVPLGIFTAAGTSRLQFLGMKVAGIHIALFGGIAASVALATSAFAQWTLAQPGVSDASAVARALHLLAFAAGGPGFTVPFGLLIAGCAVVAGLQRFVPRWLMWTGLVLSAAAELSALALIWQPAVFLLPVARFLGLPWMIAMALRLPASRPAHAA